MRTELWNKVDDDNPIQYEVLDSGYGYILLGALESATIPLKTLSAKLKEAMEFLTGQGVPGIIVDLRGNRGGFRRPCPPNLPVTFILKQPFMNIKATTIR